MTSITRAILSNTFWQVAGKLIMAILGIASIKVLTGYFNTEIYGQYTTMFDYISFFAIAADFGLYTIGVREMAKKEESVPFILGNILSLRILLILITLTSGGLIAQFIPKYTDTLIPNAIWLVALITSLFLINGTLTSVLQYKLKMLAANISQIIGKIISVGYIFFTVLYLFPSNPLAGFNHLLYGTIAANLIMVLITIWQVKTHSQIQLRFNKSYIKKLLKESAPYGISLVLSTIYFRVDIILLGWMRSLTEAGIYAVPLKIMEILSVIPVFFMNSLLPTLTEYLKESRIKAANTVNNAFQFLFLLAVPILIGGIILAFPLTFIISNTQFLSGYHCLNDSRIVTQIETEAKNICKNITKTNFAITHSGNIDNTYTYIYGSDLALKYIIFAIFFSYLNTLFNFSLVTLNQQNKLLIINFIGVTFNIISNIILIPKIGFRGAAITTILSEAIILFGTYYFYKKHLKFEINLSFINKIIFAGLIMGTTIYYLQPITFQYLQNWNTLILIPIGGIIYGSIVIATKAMTFSKLKKLLSP